MKKLLILIFPILIVSCVTLKVDLPPEDGIKGYCGDNNESIKAIALANSKIISQFEQNTDLNWGLAMSGGGIRSASFNIGALKALYDIGFLDSIDIISSVSGGSYASGWYYSNGIIIDSTNMGKALFNEENILKNICDLQNKAKMMKTQTMAKSFFLPPKMAFNKYKKGIQGTFLSDSIGNQGMNLFESHVSSDNIPQLIINTTVASTDENDWLPRVFEYSVFNRGNPEIGFDNYNVNNPVTLNEVITISGAALNFKLLRKTNNYSDKIKGKYIPLSDGGKSENLGVISLIRRGVKNIIVIDAEHNKDYSFDGYKILKKSILNELGIHLDIPSIDSFINTNETQLKTSVHVGEINSIYISPSNIKTPLTINIYYVKMAMPLTINNQLDDSLVCDEGFFINNAYDSTSCEKRKKNKKCKHYNSDSVSISLSASQFKSLSTYWVSSYSEMLENSKWKKLNYTFPHTTTADQSYYRNQMAAFIGLGYLETQELKEYLVKSSK